MSKGLTFLSYIGVMGIGVAIGVLGTRSYFEKQESERADREIESMKMAIRTTEKMNDTSGSDATTTSTITISEMVKDINRQMDERAKATEYHTFSAPSDIATSDHPREEDTIKPYFIDIDDFDEPTLGYAKKELQYYMDDGTLVDESDNTDDEGAVVSIVDTVGTANLESFENSLESCCYIRNERLKEDYEISKVFGSYSMLLGDD